MSHWPALDRWQHPEYLLAVAGQRTVPVELGRHYLADGWGQSLVSLGDFVRQHVLQAGLQPMHCTQSKDPDLACQSLCILVTLNRDLGRKLAVGIPSMLLRKCSLRGCHKIHLAAISHCR